MFKKDKVLRATVAVAIFVLFALVGVAAHMRSAVQLQPIPPSGSVSTSQAHPEAPQPKERIEMLQITVLPTGFEPAEIEHSNEKFLLAIDNQSGVEDLILELYQNNGENKPRAKLREMGLNLKSLRKRELTRLPPGRYILKEANHAEWICHITINRP